MLQQIATTLLDKDPSSHVHFGAFLRAIPVTRRIGDYAHAAARVLYAIHKRLLNACDHRCGTELSGILATLDPSSKYLSDSELLTTPASAKAGIDLTSAHLFLSSTTYIQKVVTVLQSHVVDLQVSYCPDRKLVFHVVFKYLLVALHEI